MKNLLSFLVSVLISFSVEASVKQKPSDIDALNTYSYQASLCNDYFKLQDVIIGMERAKYTLVLHPFFDCDHCVSLLGKKFQKLKKQYIDTGKIKIILRSYMDDIDQLKYSSSSISGSCCDYNELKLSNLIKDISIDEFINSISINNDNASAYNFIGYNLREQFSYDSYINSRLINRTKRFSFLSKLIKRKQKKKSTSSMALMLYEAILEMQKDFIEIQKIVIKEDKKNDSTSSFAQKLREVVLPDFLKLEDIVVGRENALNTLMIYSSFTCNHCHKFHTQEFRKFKAEYIDTGKVKIILRNYLDDMGALESSTVFRGCCAVYKQNLSSILNTIPLKEFIKEINSDIDQLSSSLKKIKNDNVVILTKQLISSNKILFDSILKDILSSQDNNQVKTQKLINTLTSFEALRLYSALFDVQNQWLKSKEPRKFLIDTFEKLGYKKQIVNKYLDSNDRDCKRITAGLMKAQQQAMIDYDIESVPGFIFNKEAKIHQGFISTEEIAKRLNSLDTNSSKQGLFQRLDPSFKEKIASIK